MNTQTKKGLLVIKIGGNVLDDEAGLNLFLKRFATISTPKVLVHGGGKIASHIGTQLGIQPSYHEGRRLTDKRTLDLVTMVYAGLINKNIVAKLATYKLLSIGLCGADGALLAASKRPVKDIDYGFVGDIECINSRLLQILLSSQYTPIICSLSYDEKQGTLLNTNADTVASALAVALSTFYDVRLIYCFEKKGVLQNIHDKESLIPHINQKTYEELVSTKVIFEGMLPKLQNAFLALEKGVTQVLIGHAEDIIDNSGLRPQGTSLTL